eukprot:Phypoly_transcript_18227.p2 GENE.Phypoly_transcript_18227~~Phypoly_transcript_18227.p2  ORF type:complete len:114 (-),score=19.23 Phypoly_transcript_18227:311-652(-)
MYIGTSSTILFSVTSFENNATERYLTIIIQKHICILEKKTKQKKKLKETTEELERFMKEDELKDAVLLLMANKQDLPNSLKPDEIAKKMDLAKTCAGRKWRIQGCCATSRWII